MAPTGTLPAPPAPLLGLQGQRSTPSGSDAEAHLYLLDSLVPARARPSWQKSELEWSPSLADTDTPASALQQGPSSSSPSGRQQSQCRAWGGKLADTRPRTGGGLGGPAHLEGNEPGCPHHGSARPPPSGHRPAELPWVLGGPWFGRPQGDHAPPGHQEGSDAAEVVLVRCDPAFATRPAPRPKPGAPSQVQALWAAGFPASTEPGGQFRCQHREAGSSSRLGRSWLEGPECRGGCGLAELCPPRRQGL